MMRVLLLMLTLILSGTSLFGSSAARAYTPESGVWWNPAESGVGYQIEVQDNFVGMFIYYYRPDGRPEWYTAAGFLQGNALFESTVERYENGMCLGCTWVRNNFDQNMGSVRVVFDANDPMRAIMTIGGRTFPIERYQFYLKRAEDGNASIRLSKMLGEWSSTIDLSSVSVNGSYPYSGDILVFDLLDLSEAPGFFDGCRADDSIDGYCSDNALAWHSASGYYDSVKRRHIIVVDDSEDFYALYELQVGTNDFRGRTSIYPKGTNPVNYYPVRGFRTASRTFVEEGVGPAKRAAATAVERNGANSGLGALLESMGAFDKVTGAGLESVGEDESLTQIRRTLEQRLSTPR